MRQIADALTFVNDHYQEEVKVCTLAQVCGMSETSFRKVFEEYVHMLPMEYVNLVRVQYACEQMKHGSICTYSSKTFQKDVSLIPQTCARVHTFTSS